MKQNTTFYLKEWRKHRGLNQQQLADRLDTTVPTISRWETGAMNWTSDWLPRFAYALNCEQADLFRNPLQPEHRLWELIQGMKPDQRDQAEAMLKILISPAKKGEKVA